MANGQTEGDAKKKHLIGQVVLGICSLDEANGQTEGDDSQRQLGTNVEVLLCMSGI